MSTEQPTASTDGEPAVTLYRLQACPFCERVVRLLHEYDVPFQSRYVEPMHSARDVVKREAGVRTVPVIVDERTGVTMAESAAIAEYVEAEYGDGAARTDGRGDDGTSGDDAEGDGGDA